MKINKLKKLVRWAIVNGSVAYAAYEASKGSQGWGNVLTFFVTFSGTMMLLGAIIACGSKKIQTKPSDLAVNATISHLVGITFIGFFAFQGWIFTAFMALLNEIGESMIRAKIAESQSENKNENQ